MSKQKEMALRIMRKAGMFEDHKVLLRNISKTQEYELPQGLPLGFRAGVVKAQGRIEQNAREAKEGMTDE